MFEFDKDLFYSLCEKYNVEFSDKYDKPEVMGLEERKIIEQLFCVITELDARDCGSNSVISEYHNTSWNNLCDIGIELFKQLKE